MNNKTLLIIFGVLIGIYVLSKVMSGNKERTFNADILTFDTSVVDRIEVDLLEGEDYVLENIEGNWIARKPGVEVQTLPGSVNNLLAQAASLKVLRIATKSKDKWPNYEIEEGKAKAKISFKSAGKNLQSLVLGGFRFNQQARSAKSFVRKADEDEVYVIDGFASMSLGQSFDSFRDKKLLKLDREEITGVDIQTPNTFMSISRSMAGWIDENGVVLDSTKVANYFNKLVNYNAAGFNDNYNLKKDFENTISIHTTQQNIPYQIHLTSVENETMPFVLESTMVPNTTFAGDSTNALQALILSRSDFLN